MRGIIWLASYPKSGNTWLRVILTSLLRGAREPVGINTLSEIAVAGGRNLLDHWSGLELSDLTPDEIQALRPDVYRAYAREAPGPTFVKIHDACTPPDGSASLVPADATRGVLYLLRNPLDVAVSYAHHLAISVEAAIEVMADETHALYAKPSGIANQVRQVLGSWSTNVLSWTDSGLPCHVIRYEDMTRAPFQTVRAALDAVGLDYADDLVHRAIEHSRFDRLQRQERLHSFREGSREGQSLFFRSGTVGDWRSHLSRAEVDRIIARHRRVMERFGYLDAQGHPVF